MPKPANTGKFGEQMAEYRFKLWGWKMFRHQSRTVIARKNGKPCTIQCKSDGVPDYTGYEMVLIVNQKFPIYRAVEVKEAAGRTMPAKRLSDSQIRWLLDCSPVSGFVAVVWTDGQPTIELFRPIEHGSYKKGDGLSCPKSTVTAE